MTELEKLARAATPGKWEFRVYSRERVIVHAPTGQAFARVLCRPPHTNTANQALQADANAAFIAAANPATILALIAERDALRAGLEPFARFSDVLSSQGGNTPRGGVWYGLSSKDMGDAEITVEDLSRARQLLTPRSETPDNLMEGEK